jgi:hypothetical protein
MFPLIAVGADFPHMSRVVNELPLDDLFPDSVMPATNLLLQFASKALGKWKQFSSNASRDSSLPLRNGSVRPSRRSPVT